MFFFARKRQEKKKMWRNHIAYSLRHMDVSCTFQSATAFLSLRQLSEGFQNNSFGRAEISNLMWTRAKTLQELGLVGTSQTAKDWTQNGRLVGGASERRCVNPCNFSFTTSGSSCARSRGNNARDFSYRTKKHNSKPVCC
jgi:hypothetical protein